MIYPFLFDVEATSAFALKMEIRHSCVLNT